MEVYICIFALKFAKGANVTPILKKKYFMANKNTCYACAVVQFKGD